MGCLRLFNWLRLDCFLLRHHSFKFLSFGVKSENPSLATIWMDHVHLRPSCVVKTSMMTLAINIIREFVLLTVLIASDALSLPERQSTLYTHLIVRFNLKVLVTIIEDAGQVLESAIIVVAIIWIHLVRPPSLEFFNRRFDSNLARKHLSLAHLR